MKIQDENETYNKTNWNLEDLSQDLWFNMQAEVSIPVN